MNLHDERDVLRTGGFAHLNVTVHRYIASDSDTICLSRGFQYISIYGGACIPIINRLRRSVQSLKQECQGDECFFELFHDNLRNIISSWQDGSATN